MLALFLTSCFWGLSFALSKMALVGLNAPTLSFTRLTLGAFLLLILFRPSARFFFRPPVIIFGILEFGLTYWLYLQALNYLPSGTVGMLTLTTPVFLFLFGVIRGIAPLNTASVLAVIASLVGGALCLPANAQVGLNLSPTEMKGVILILLSNISFALGNIVVMKMRGFYSREHTPWGLVWGALFVFILAPPYFTAEVLQTKSLLLVAYLGLIPTGLGFWLWNKGANECGVLATSVYSNLKGPLSVIFGFIILGESISWLNVVGGLALFWGAIMLSRKPARS